MKKSPLSLKIYIWIVVLMAVILMICLSSDITVNSFVLRGGVFFAVLAIITDSLPVPLPKEGSLTVTVAVAYASIILFGPAVTAYIMIVTLFFSTRVFTKEKSPWYKLIFNCSQFVLATGLSGILYKVFGGEFGKIDLYNFFPYLVAAVTYIAINGTAFSLVISLSQGTSLYGVWLTNMRWALPNVLMLAPLGLIMAKVYSYTGPVGVVLFFVPLLLARYIFKSFMETREIFLNTLEALARAIDAKDNYTWGHSDRVAQYAVELARAIKLPEDQVEIIEHMALLHDVGKIGVSDELLTRVGYLSEEEFNTIKVHPVIGANILKDINYHGAVPDFIRHHHERYDGTGYPDRLKGEEIPLGARIITLADSFDAMTSDRSYRSKMSFEEALAELKRCSGTHFDPQLVEAFIECYEKKASTVNCSSIAETALTSIK